MVQGDTGSAHVAQTVIVAYLTYFFFLFFGLEFFLHERESNSESRTHECTLLPLCHLRATTIASACNVVFRQNHLKPGMIGLIPPWRLQESGEAVRSRHQVAEVAVGIGRNPDSARKKWRGVQGRLLQGGRLLRGVEHLLRVQRLPLPRVSELLRGEGGEALQRLDAGRQVPADVGQGEGDQGLPASSSSPSGSASSMPASPPTGKCATSLPAATSSPL